MANNTAIAHVLGQVNAAKPELDAYAPEEVGWHKRALAAVNMLVPWLVQEAPGLRAYVEEVLNSPALLRSACSFTKAATASGSIRRVFRRSRTISSRTVRRMPFRALQVPSFRAAEQAR